VCGTVGHFPAWRLAEVDESFLVGIDLTEEIAVEALLKKIHPQTIFDLATLGAYSFQTDVEGMYQVNFHRVVTLTQKLLRLPSCIYLHAGSSSEYGEDSFRSKETQVLRPNSHYAVSKAAVAGLLFFLGQKKHFRSANLRLYSIYGPLEDSSRLIPNLILQAHVGDFPPFVHPEISRDFVYVEDACLAFVETALRLSPADYGHSFNVGSGVQTTIEELAYLTREMFQIQKEPIFSGYEERSWDRKHWCADPEIMERCLGWKAQTDLSTGLRKTSEWLKALPDLKAYQSSSKKFFCDDRYSVSAIIACYRDAQAIPIMYQRLTETFRHIGLDYEIIFVNDSSPDDAEEVIREISSRDHKVLGISHSRNFGSQAAFRSGMELATKNACVLLDGDLQDPPELIEDFVKQWKEGFEVVYGRRVKREAPFLMQIAYKLFYYLFQQFSYISIPRDAGDFSLIERKVMQKILQFPERDLFLRGVRAYAGFKQVGVDYVRPERLFGVTTNNFWRNMGWAKKGFLSYTHIPLNVLSFFGVILFIFSVLLAFLQLVIKLLFPASAPAGITTVILSIIFFGSINLLGISLLGEYLAKIFEEVKRRPHFIRRAIVKGGKVRNLTDAEDMSSEESSFQKRV